ncbi:uncharacterized protein LOC103361593 [Stegastes partitus]|uniref:Uncharacterized protein LOC103361593 n=1 Tax=Stegastes partitus TaxID=144197 RepID=A0A9Y4K2M9_9TELE|nr:PREDICTED: uncharacterized protein LOC103361593 [Stegastes partitus]XP_008285934.1 PREDICTED: uncharacterized protein LOC103361593 [Stegastes partitus]
MPGGSTTKTCPFCQTTLFCAQKTCTYCKQEQPTKLRLKRKLERFDEKRKEWVVGRKRAHNASSVKDEAIILLEKLHALGYKPVLLLGKQNKSKKKLQCKILTPRCSLTAYAKDSLEKIGSLFERVCKAKVVSLKRKNSENSSYTPGNKKGRHMPRRKQSQRNCSYHTRLEALPFRTVLQERVRKGKLEILIDWEPCPECGKEWAPSWQPKESICT